MKQAVLCSSILVMLSVVVFATNDVCKTYPLSDEIFAAMPFVRHEDPGFGSYIARDISHAPIFRLKQQLVYAHNMHLKDRGEAHITVLTPPEYQRIKSKVSIAELNDLVAGRIEDASFTPTCIGHGQLGDAHAFFIVVKSDKLLSLRREIEALVQKRHGSKLDFNAEAFYPHITVGFTERDLHLEDGIIKDETSCIAAIEILPLSFK